MAEIKDRLTVVEMVYHQRLSDMEEPTVTEARFSRDLLTKEQVYSRQTTIGEDWQPLDCGWLKGNVGMLLIQNDAGRFTTVIPTAEERAEEAKKIIEICYGDTAPLWLIYPQESMRGCPKSPDELSIRCRSGSTKFTLTAIPA